MSADKYATTIANLLAKADASEFPAEAETFLNKAMSLMAEHSISMAMIDAARSPEERTQVIMADPILIPKPYDIHKGVLFHKIAEALGCHYYTDESYSYDSDYSRRSKVRHGVIAGTPADVEAATTLFHSLLIQLQRDLNKQADVWGNTKGHRINFIAGFTNEVVERIRKANRAAQQEQEAQVEAQGQLSESVGLALLDKAQFVAEKVNEMYQEKGIKLRTTRIAPPSGGYGGYSAGREAGARADIGGARLGGRKELGA